MTMKEVQICNRKTFREKRDKNQNSTFLNKINPLNSVYSREYTIETD